MSDAIHEIMAEACADAGYVAAQRPVPTDGTETAYVSWQVQTGVFRAAASNRPRRMRITVAVDLWSRAQPTGREVIELMRVLRDHGLHPVSWGPEDFEEDTLWHHMPITCHWYTDYSEEG